MTAIPERARADAVHAALTRANPARRRPRIKRERIGNWRELLWLEDGRELLLRPIEALDAEPLRRGFSLLTPEEVRMRFLHPITDLTPDYALQLCSVDRASGFALVVAEPLPPGEALIGAVARMAIDLDRGEADFALIVGRILSGQGLGTYLLKKLIRHARLRKLHLISGDVREENARMFAICESLGFTRHHAPDEPGIVRVQKLLGREDPTA